MTRPRFTLVFVYLFGLLVYEIVQGQSPALESAGDVILLALPSTALGGSLIAKDYEGTFQFAKGFVLNQAITFGLKYVIDKKRPFGNGDRAFPSGHTSTTFQSAAFIQRRYGWKYGIPAYLLSGFTGYSRLNARRHDGWDVLAGAMVGIGSAYLFTTDKKDQSLKWTYYSCEGNYMLGIQYRF